MNEQIHTYYSAIKSNGITINATTQINLADIMKSKETSHKRSHILWFNLYEMSRQGNSQTEINGCLELGGREIGLLLDTWQRRNDYYWIQGFFWRWLKIF